MGSNRMFQILNINGKRKQGKSPEDFWREYEEQTGEKIIARSLGRYVSGWDEFGDPPDAPLWGLIVATSGGFRFHHFPQANWVSNIIRLGSANDPPGEKTIFIPSERIVSAVLRKETRWHRKIFLPGVPRLVVCYRDDNGAERELLLLAEYKPDGLAEALVPSS